MSSDHLTLLREEHWRLNVPNHRWARAWQLEKTFFDGEKTKMQKIQVWQTSTKMWGVFADYYFNTWLMMMMMLMMKMKLEVYPVVYDGLGLCYISVAKNGPLSSSWVFWTRKSNGAFRWQYIPRESTRLLVHPILGVLRDFKPQPMPTQVELLLLMLESRVSHGNLRGPPQMPPPPRNSRPY